MYKKSIYNIIIGNVEDSNLIYNSFSGGVSQFDNYSYTIMENIDKYVEETATKEDRELKNVMYDNGFIVDKDFDELSWLLVHNKSIRYDMHSTRLRLTIAPTMSCNYKCYYCYESKAYKSKMMTEETIEQLISYVEGQLNDDLKLLNISWYGGEPMLAIDIIGKISKRIIKLCQDKNIEYRADILTNGYLLDYKTAQLLYNEYKVYDVQIPMDGMLKTYATRKGVSEEAFNKVIKNIKEISDFMNVHVRMNIDNDNKEEILELTKLLLVDYGLKEKIRVYLAAVKNYTNVCDFTGEGCFSSDEFFAFKKEFTDFLYSLNAEKSITKTIPIPSWITCGLSRIRNLVIDPDGNFYRCAHLIGHDNSNIGNIKIGQVYNEANLNYIFAEIQDKCKECVLVPICMGGCVFERMLNGGDSVCRERIERLQHDIMLAYDYL